MRVEYIVVHCTDSPDDRDVTAEEVHSWHRKRGWAGIGYHKVIKRDGTIDEGRPEYWEGAHVKGYNHNSLGVCLVGKEFFSYAQMRALEKIILELAERYPEAKVVGHRDLDSRKPCPNFDVKEWWRRVYDGVVD